MKFDATQARVTIGGVTFPAPRFDLDRPPTTATPGAHAPVEVTFEMRTDSPEWQRFIGSMRSAGRRARRARGRVNSGPGRRFARALPEFAVWHRAMAELRARQRDAKAAEWFVREMRAAGFEVVPQ